ncbi:hypothetical protein HPB51_016414 [Rhipicephalus microplus]|uniref:C2H2-type domain-containing protein n=1 Tax=Rhipicephalus microplus TaxID=6941 RepID=A0A9J6EAN9_RHIMP|nr:hypothetical protein HPB51_016414 [Rhipicephalus microplus]
MNGLMSHQVAVSGPTTEFTVDIKKEPDCIEESSCDNNAPSRENIRPLDCHLCPHTAKTAHALKDHLLAHSEEKKYECSTCSRRFRYQRNLRRHTHSHCSKKRYSCKRCSQDKPDKNVHNHHLTRHHHKANKGYACPMCSYLTPHHADMVKHLRIHTSDRPFKYAYATANNSALIRHTRMQHENLD